MKHCIPLLTLFLSGCPWVSNRDFAKVEDADLDGTTDARFDGRDCDDFDAGVGDCDQDRDGVQRAPFGDDCDDDDPTIHPGAAESCDDLDHDCDGQPHLHVPASQLTTFYVDDDGDGHGGDAVLACEQPSATVPTGGDCDDADPNINPGAAELCDGVDHNCDGSFTNGAADPDVYTPDEDGDGWGRAVDPNEVVACEAPQGFGLRGDCDDTAPHISPQESERCNGFDDDCDGLVDDADDTLADATVFSLDRDGDGYGGVGTEVVQCTDPSTDTLNYSPGAGVDCNDFDGSVTSETLWFVDQDGDGFGFADDASQHSCVAPIGYASNDDDCDDTSAAVNPDAEETCDPLDRDCDGSATAHAIDPASYSPDADGDGWGRLDAGVTVQACAAPAGLARVGDCDDANAHISPDAVERCNGLDDDCDGAIDDDDLVSDAIVYSLDRDGDGLGGVGTEIVQCTDPSTAGLVYVQAAGIDCNDFDATILSEVSWYADADGDGYGHSDAPPVSACAAPAAHARATGDCDDSSAQVSPEGVEVCNDRDDDCDGSVDEGAADFTYYLDEDGDGFGLAGATVQGCVQPAHHAVRPGDCDDTLATVNPLSLETCNGIDDDCDSLVDDDDLVANLGSYYLDADGDGFGLTSTLVTACVPPPHHAALSGDCDDAEPLVFPGALEVCNDRDDDCDSLVDDDDLVAGQQRFYFDGDEDDHGRSETFQDRCVAPPGFVPDGDDCDDDDASAFRLVSTWHEGADPDEVQQALEETCEGGLLRFDGMHALALQLPDDRSLGLTSLDASDPAVLSAPVGSPLAEVGQRSALDVIDLQFTGTADVHAFQVSRDARLSLEGVVVDGLTLTGSAELVHLEDDAVLDLTDVAVTDVDLQTALIGAGEGAVVTAMHATFADLRGGGVLDIRSPGAGSTWRSVWIEQVAAPVLRVEGDAFSTDNELVFTDFTVVDTGTFLTSLGQPAALSGHRWIRVGDDLEPALDITDSTVQVEESEWIRTGGVFFTTDSILLFARNSVARLQGGFLLGGNAFPPQPPIPDCGTLRFNALIEDSLFVDHGLLAPAEAFLDKLPPDGVGKFADNRLDHGHEAPTILRANLGNPCKESDVEEHTVGEMKLVQYDTSLHDEVLQLRAVLDYGAATPAMTSLFDPDAGSQGKIVLGPNAGEIGGDSDSDQIEDVWELLHFGSLDNCAWREDYACGGVPLEHTLPGGACEPDPLPTSCP